MDVIAAIEDGARQEAIAGARRLAAIAELTRRRVDDDDERVLWAFDAWDSAAAEVGAAMAVGLAPCVGADADRRSAARPTCLRLRRCTCKGALSTPAGVSRSPGAPGSSQDAEACGR